MEEEVEEMEEEEVEEEEVMILLRHCVQDEGNFD